MTFTNDDTFKTLHMEGNNIVSFEVSDPPFDIDRPEHTKAYPRYTSFTFLDVITLETRRNQKFYNETEKV
jgi:hypothetical protein